jgi:nitrogen fixation NifU-like protein
VAGLEDLYREVILDHYRNPRNRGELECPPAHRVEGFNPLCGDDIVLFLEVEDGRISEIRSGGQGCSISQSSTSIMSTVVKGRSVTETIGLIHQFKAMMGLEPPMGDPSHQLLLPIEPDGTPDELSELAALQGVVKFPVRIKCATLGWNTLTQGLTELGFITK